MSEPLLDGRVLLHCGDCRAVLATLVPDSIDAVVTDPPYALSFMGKAWDHAAVAFDPALWALVHRALKPGGHLLAMGGTRTVHRLACAIEDAGFEIRDTISWLYGSGFPKSHDVSKGIDRAAGAEREVVGVAGKSGSARACMAGDFVGGEYMATAPATDAARQWAGWGTALKPACELIVLARKPLSEGTVAANVLRWGTGAINVDGCRVATNGEDMGDRNRFANCDEHPGWKRPSHTPETIAARGQRALDTAEKLGRWPANIAHDGSDEVTAAFPETASGGGERNSAKDAGIYGAFAGDEPARSFDANTGSAARFFYTSKADADDRLGSKHPTVKPLDLMQWLVRMVTPRNGVCLDPFAGTGTTGEAAFREGMRAVLIEAEAEYQADIRRRMALALAGPDERSRESIKAKNLPRDDGPLFSEWREMWAKPFDFSQEPS